MKNAARNLFSSKTGRGFLVAIVVLLPSILAIALPAVFWGKSIFEFVPNSSDEIIYWREIGTFADYGFGGGQYSTDEKPAQFAASPFGSHGPVFAILYGSIGRVVGWQPNTAVTIHLFIVPLTLLLTISIARPSLKQLLILGLLWLTWWPLQLYLPSNMQEVLYMCAAILMAAMFYRYIIHPTTRRRYAIYIGLLILALLPLRFIWGALVFPLVLLYPGTRSWKTWLAALLAMTAVLLAGVAFVKVFYSYYPWYSSELLDLLLSSPLQGLREMLTHFAESLALVVSVEKGLPLVILVRYQLLGLLVAVSLWIIRAVRKKEGWEEIRQPLFHFICLGAVLAFVLFFYDVLDTRDYRMFIGPLLLSCVLLIFFGHHKFVYPIVLTNFVLAYAFFSYYPNFRYQNFNADRDLLQQVDESINPYLQFDPAADRWCNTISISKYGEVQAIGFPLTALHRGFGITTILDWKELRGGPLNAKYVLLDPQALAEEVGNVPNQFDLTELSTSPVGTLYLNPQANCQ